MVPVVTGRSCRELVMVDFGRGAGVTMAPASPMESVGLDTAMGGERRSVMDFGVVLTDLFG